MLDSEWMCKLCGSRLNSSHRDRPPIEVLYRGVAYFIFNLLSVHGLNSSSQPKTALDMWNFSKLPKCI